MLNWSIIFVMTQKENVSSYFAYVFQASPNA